MHFSKAIIKLYKTEYKNIIFCDEKDEKGNLKIFKFGEFIIDVVIILIFQKEIY